MSTYSKKTGQRPNDERSLSVRAAHRNPVDIHKLAEALIRLTLQESGKARADARATELPETLRDRPNGPVGVTVQPVE